MPVKISVLGCVVNGPGEAREAAIGIAGGKGVGYLYRRGEPIRRVDESDIVDAVLDELKNWDDKGNFIGTGDDILEEETESKGVFPILNS